MVRTTSATPKPTTPVKPAVAETKKTAPKNVKNTVVPTPEPVKADAPEEEAAVDGEETVASKMADFNAKLQQAVAILSGLKGSFKGLEKDISRQLKASLKASTKKSKRSGNRQPSGFVRPTLISDELAAFLEKSRGTEMARTEVSKEINKYIRSNNLQDKDNGRQINADAKLKALLKLNAGDVLTYFNLQRYMKHHFIKASTSAPAPSLVPTK